MRTDWIWQQKRLSASAKLVLLRLCDLANRDGECWPSQTRIAADCELSRKTVNQALKQLVEREIVEAKAQNENGAKIVSRYSIRCNPTLQRCDAGLHGGVVSDVTLRYNYNLPLEDTLEPSGSNGADAPPPSPFDPVKDLFDRGLAILGGPTAGHRSLLGKMRREYGDPAVLAAIVECETTNPSEPAAYFIGCCKQRKSDANIGTAQSGIAKLAAWAIAEDERQSLRRHPEAAA